MCNKKELVEKEIQDKYTEKDLELTQKIADELGITEYGTVSLSSRRRTRRPYTVTNSSRRNMKEDK